MRKLLAIGEAAALLGVSVTTLRRWEVEGKLIPERTMSGHRRYDLDRLKSQMFPPQNDSRRTIAYARISHGDCKRGLDWQKRVLELYCAQRGWVYEMFSEVGSGLNFKNEGLKKILADIMDDKVSRLVVTHKDRLLRIGADMVLSICEIKQVDVIILNQGEDTVFEEDLNRDAEEIVKIFQGKFGIKLPERYEMVVEGID
ncbi:IS607 family transposase [Gynuella sunshinyii]|uniref:Putative site-specific integrase-resolvase n=1 Tax=Gynuella sunshinyii YC6258 TaxID=1445510 RepID=A0A0C5VZ66_9GAMM|nr:IS607 family transposase [Gynuella sunshinyii]AJQ95709.1 putative site-specific integrase-resolvase [Gynuella sunshinyii YC6258]